MVTLFTSRIVPMFSIQHVACNAILGSSCKMAPLSEYACQMVSGVGFNLGSRENFPQKLWIFVCLSRFFLESDTLAFVSGACLRSAEC